LNNANTAQKAASTTINLMPGSTALTIVFVLLKAFDKIDWSWWLVFAPIWGPFALIFGILGVGLVLYLVLMAIVGVLELADRSYRSWKRRK